MHTGTNKPIRVLAVDDSAVMRGIMRMLFQAHQRQPQGDAPAMELCGIVEDGVECMEAVLRLRPDVVVLDLEMPRMHGLDVLKRLRLEEPGLPVIMCSAYTERGARSTLQALALGAADYVMKPGRQSDLSVAIETLASELMPKIAALAGSRGAVRIGLRSARAVAGPLESSEDGGRKARVEMVVIGVSTGGPSALEAMLPKLAKDFPVPVMIVQHMPKLFTGALAQRLDRCCSLRVREAQHGAELLPGTIWLAPGDAHMEISEASDSARNGSGIRAFVKLHQRPSPNRCKPSVDYLFASAARIYGAGTLALVMTGMGSDGLSGARQVHEAGGTVLTQDAATSAVWGMPGRVFEAGISRAPLPLHGLAGELTGRASARRSMPAPVTVCAPLPIKPREMFALSARSEVVHEHY